MERQLKVNGDAVRTLREERSWSQEHLANAAGLSVRTVQRVELESTGSAETRLALAAALGVPVGALMPDVAPQSTHRSDERRLFPRWAWVSLASVVASVIAIVLISASVRPAAPIRPAPTMSFSMFLSQAEEGQIQSVEIKDDIIIGQLSNGEEFVVNNIETDNSLLIESLRHNSAFIAGLAQSQSPKILAARDAIPEGVIVTSMNEFQNFVHIAGTAPNNEALATYLRNLRSVGNPTIELIERDADGVGRFVMTVHQRQLL